MRCQVERSREAGRPEIDASLSPNERRRRSERRCKRCGSCSPRRRGGNEFRPERQEDLRQQLQEAEVDTSEKEKVEESSVKKCFILRLKGDLA